MVFCLETRVHGDELKNALGGDLTRELHTTVPRREAEDIVPDQGDEVGLLWRRFGTAPVDQGLPVVVTAVSASTGPLWWWWGWSSTIWT
jgi:hypothetical protein